MFDVCDSKNDLFTYVFHTGRRKDLEVAPHSNRNIMKFDSKSDENIIESRGKPVERRGRKAAGSNVLLKCNDSLAAKKI